MSFFCGICMKYYNEPGSSPLGLDNHLVRVHYLDVGKENGKATLAENGLKPSPYKPENAFTFRRTA